MFNGKVEEIAEEELVVHFFLESATVNIQT